MRMFFVAVGILAWLFASSVLWIFAESGGALAVIAAGVFAGVAIVSLGLERVLKLLELIRDRALPSASIVARDVARDAEMRERTVATAKNGPLPA